MKGSIIIREYALPYLYAAEHVRDGKSRRNYAEKRIGISGS